MRSKVVRFVLALSLVVSVGSLVGSRVAAGGLEGCCVCTGCGLVNGTVMGPGIGGAICADAGNPSLCDGICADAGCLFNTFENATCSDPSLADACGDPSLAPVPTASSFGLMALVALLLGFGTFLLRERRA